MIDVMIEGGKPTLRFGRYLRLWICTNGFGHTVTGKTPAKAYEYWVRKNATT